MGWLAYPFTAVLLAAVVVGTCAVRGDTGAGAVKVDLGKRSMISQVRQTGDYILPGDKVLRVAIAGVVSPANTLDLYQELLELLGRRTGRQISLVLKPTYSDTYNMIKEGRVDLALVCTLAYVKGREDFGMELLVAPQVRGDTVYYSYLIVTIDSMATGLADLAKGVFAFSDPLSNTGYLVPVYMLQRMGEKPETFFRRYIYTYSHENSIMAVADRLLDGAAVDSLVYDQMIAAEPKLLARTKIIARWGPYGIPPVVVSPTMDSHLKERVRDVFLRLHESPDGRAILSGLGIDRFVVVSHERYESVRQMMAEVGVVIR